MQFNFFQSASTVRSFLKNKYEQQYIDDAERKSYDNCYPFMYYLEQGETYYAQAAQSPFSIRPVLLYYGLIHLIKACLLTVDPNYPGTTSVLAHGVSARKRKKRNYQFFDDEVKIQKNGLCTYFSEQMLNLKYLEGEKFKMEDLLEQIPELDELYLFSKGESNFISLEKLPGNIWAIPDNAADRNFINLLRLKQVLENKHPEKIIWIGNGRNEEELLIDGNQTDFFPPFRFHIIKETYGLDASLKDGCHLPDLLIHYLLLFNLSMIARYETEWWIDLIKTAADLDYPFIHAFLKITAEKSPLMILEYLKK
jgi:hypothetical protein